MKEINEITIAHEAILKTLEQQFAKFVRERENKEDKIREDAESIVYSDLPLAQKILMFLEWDTNALLLEEQRIDTLTKYKDSLIEFVQGVESNTERVEELEEELRAKDETIEDLQNRISDLQNEFGVKASKRVKTVVRKGGQHERRGRPKKAQAVQEEESEESTDNDSEGIDYDLIDTDEEDTDEEDAVEEIKKKLRLDK